MATKQPIGWVWPAAGKATILIVIYAALVLAVTSRPRERNVTAHQQSKIRARQRACPATYDNIMRLPGIQ